MESIVTLLPTPDVQSLRRASPVFATLSLSEAFWESRFREGAEFEHIPEVFSTRPESWRALYISLYIWASENAGMANRMRIWKIAKGLLRTVQQMEGVNCNGKPFKTYFEPNALEDGRGEDDWVRGGRRPVEEEDSFEAGFRALRVRSIDFPQPVLVKTIYVNLIRTQKGVFLAGLLFCDEDGPFASLGYLSDKKMSCVTLPRLQTLQGWEISLDQSGIRAIRFVLEDGAETEWIGPHTYPSLYHCVRRVTDIRGVSSIQAEFDVRAIIYSGGMSPTNNPQALKLVSLSRDRVTPTQPTDLRRNFFWSTLVPQEGWMFNGLAGDTPKQPRYDFQSDLPVQIVLFRYQDDLYGSSLTRIQSFSYDGCFLVNLTFHHDAVGHAGILCYAFCELIFQHDAPTRFGLPPGTIVENIDGPGGEAITSIDVQASGDIVVGLKVALTPFYVLQG
ncbi:hypothetical protein IL306_014710 [Fusarium sp. DS 682]|nr:hypothetical protein IL306_014710 [Fusarium sp. DS 682]